MNIYASYLCNFKCGFCSIRKEHSPTLDLEWVRKELSKHPELCSNINILGGEPSILPLDYQEKLVSICTEAAGEKPYYITNMFKVSPVLEKCRPIVSYDFGLRQEHRKVLNNILALEVDFSLSTVLTRYLVHDVGSKKYLKLINSLPRCKRADLDLYYMGKDGQENHVPDDGELLDFVRDVMTDPKVNLAPLSAMRKRIDSSLDNVSDYLAFMPGNKYGVRLDYGNGPYRMFQGYEETMEYYRSRIRDSHCNQCEFIKTCWNPCYDDVCRGNKKMLEMFRDYVLSFS